MESSPHTTGNTLNAPRMLFMVKTSVWCMMNVSVADRAKVNELKRLISDTPTHFSTNLPQFLSYYYDGHKRKWFLRKTGSLNSNLQLIGCVLPTKNNLNFS